METLKSCMKKLTASNELNKKFSLGILATFMLGLAIEAGFLLFNYKTPFYEKNPCFHNQLLEFLLITAICGVVVCGLMSLGTYFSKTPQNNLNATQTSQGSVQVSPLEQ